MPPSELISPSNKMGDLLLDDNSAVADWYAGRSVFITGATGYMGKVLVEKLLRSCPNIEKIYMLMRTRPNKDRDLNSRLQIFTESRAFENIRRKDPTIFSKLVVVSGDISKPDLGISREDREVLKSKISVVFHVAATVKFMAPIRESVEINIVGTKAVLALCREVANLAAMVHVSTAFSNCDIPEIEEKIYPQEIDPDGLIDCLNWMSNDFLEKVTPALLGSKPNTYVLTKALAESLIQKAKGLPVAIVRPSIVTAAWMEPHPGWVDSNSGIHALVLGGARGVIRTFPGDPKNQADFIPVDIPINMMIVAAWHTARTFSFSPSQYEPTVYNATSGARNPTTWGILEILNETAKKYPVNKGLLMYPVFHFDPNPYLNQWLFLLQHKLPARLADWVAVLQGNKPRWVRVYETNAKAKEVLEYFVNHRWDFHVDNVMSLKKQLSSADQAEFPFDIADMDWSTYINNYYFGIREFVNQEEMNTVPTARKKLRRLYIVHRVIQCFLIIFPMLLLFTFFSILPIKGING